MTARCTVRPDVRYWQTRREAPHVGRLLPSAACRASKVHATADGSRIPPLRVTIAPRRAGPLRSWSPRLAGGRSPVRGALGTRPADEGACSTGRAWCRGRPADDGRTGGRRLRLTCRNTRPVLHAPSPVTMIREPDDSPGRSHKGRAGREVTPGTSSRSALEVQAGRWVETGRTVTLNRYGTTPIGHRALRTIRRPSGRRCVRGWTCG